MTSNSQAREQDPRPKEKKRERVNTELLRVDAMGTYAQATEITNLIPMSHLRFYRGILSHECATLSAATVELQSLRLCRVNKHGFCTTFPVSRSAFTSTSTIQDDEIVPYLVFSKLID